MLFSTYCILCESRIKYWTTFISSFILFIISIYPCMAQNTSVGTTVFQIEMSGSAATGKYTPFWIVSNKYGTIPLDAGNACLRTQVTHLQSLGKEFHWSVGIDVIAATPRYRNIYVQQLFASIHYKNLNLTIGSKENYSSLWDKELSSGDMVHSSNARPIPEINLSVPKFTALPFTKRRLQYKGEFAFGQSFDTQYLQSYLNDNTNFVKNIRWHHKSLHLRLLDPNNQFPLTAVIGMRHHAQWGGTSTNSALGKQPQSFKDLIRILLGKSGDESASLSDQINVLGNHYGSYDFKIGYLSPAFDVHIYMQHFFEDVSGMELYNFPDGLWGLQVDMPNISWINKIVIEYLDTRNQSGPVHYLWLDHDLYPGHGRGSDNYYNNGEYTTGVSYFNRGIGSPLLTSPEYNENKVLGFKDNRVRAFHVGLQGYLSKQLLYNILATSSESWGTMHKPYLKKKSNIACIAKISYCHPRLEDWLFTGEIATDYGTNYGNNAGICLSIKKTGFIKQR